MSDNRDVARGCATAIVLVVGAAILTGLFWRTLAWVAGW